MGEMKDIFEDDIPMVEWHHSCLETTCGTMFVAGTKETFCRRCGSFKLHGKPVLRKTTGGCILEPNEKVPVENDFGED